MVQGQKSVGGVLVGAPVKTGKSKISVPEDFNLNLTFPERRGEALFDSPQELFKSTLRIFSKMLQRIRKTSPKLGNQSFRRKKVSTNQAGRKLRLVWYHPDRNSLAPYETVLHALLRYGRPEKGKRLRIDPNDFLGWERQIQESLTLVLAVDVSRSTMAFKDLFADIIRSLSSHFNRHRDRIGLVSVSGRQAEILNHPSRNHRVVVKAIGQLNIMGQTPIGDGLVKSLEMVKMERTRNPGSKPVVILLSDCFPEPITHRYDDIFDEPTYRHAISAADLFRRLRVSLLVINPQYRDLSKAVSVRSTTMKQTPGERLTDRIIKRSGGRLIKLQTKVHDTALSQSTSIAAKDQQIKNILMSIESAFSGR
ncbi:VWA domain-containing protein [bacterium]|nr:VWA domain-containing protein [bacterium]